MTGSAYSDGRSTRRATTLRSTSTMFDESDADEESELKLQSDPPDPDEGTVG